MFEHDLDRISLFQLAGNMYAHIDTQRRRGEVPITPCLAKSLQIHFHNLCSVETRGIAFAARQLHFALPGNKSSKRDERAEVFQHGLGDRNYRAEQFVKVRTDHVSFIASVPQESPRPPLDPAAQV